MADPIVDAGPAVVGSVQQPLQSTDMPPLIGAVKQPLAPIPAANAMIGAVQQPMQGQPRP